MSPPNPLPDQSERPSRDPLDYTIEVCAVCGCGLSMGIGPDTGRCIHPEHRGIGGTVIRVVARPAAEQTHRYGPDSRMLARLVAAGAVPVAFDERRVP